MRILLGGFGVVGQALVRLLDQRRAELYSQFGLQPRLVGVLDARGGAVSESGLNVDELISTKQSAGTVGALAGHGLRDFKAEELIVDSDADVFILATPTLLTNPTPAINLLKAAFRSSKHVVCVNKAPLAVAMPGLLELARYNRRQLRFSGTVGAGTPILEWARQVSRGDTITKVRAILNGTTNFILSRMTKDGQSFDDALAEAQRLGYAETDPSADIDGIDTAVKIVILSNYVMGRSATLKDVKMNGIRGLPRERIAQAAKKGQVVKLVGQIAGDLTVQPMEIQAGDALDVTGGLNAVTLTLERGGDTTLVGRGAGGAETATGIVRDLLDIWDVMGHVE